MSVKGKTPSPPGMASGNHTAIPAPELPPGEPLAPEAGERGEAAPSPRIAGSILIAAGILLMALSGWMPMPDETALKNASEASATTGANAAGGSEAGASFFVSGLPKSRLAASPAEKTSEGERYAGAEHLRDVHGDRRGERRGERERKPR